MQTDEEEEEEDHAEADESIEELKAAAKVRAKKALVVVPSRAATPVVEGPPSPLSVSSTEDLYRPVKSKSRAGRGAVDKPAKVVVVEEEGTLVAKPKKRKAPAAAEEGKKSGMLGEKSANAKSGGKKEEGATKKRKEKVLVVVDEAEEGADEPKKKKKRTLFGGPKKFEWGSIEVSFLFSSSSSSFGRGADVVACAPECRRQFAGSALQALADQDFCWGAACVGDGDVGTRVGREEVHLRSLSEEEEEQGVRFSYWRCFSFTMPLRVLFTPVRNSMPRTCRLARVFGDVRARIWWRELGPACGAFAELSACPSSSAVVSCVLIYPKSVRSARNINTNT